MKGRRFEKQVSGLGSHNKTGSLAISSRLDMHALSASGSFVYICPTLFTSVFLRGQTFNEQIGWALRKQNLSFG